MKRTVCTEIRDIKKWQQQRQYSHDLIRDIEKSANRRRLLKELGGFVGVLFSFMAFAGLVYLVLSHRI